MVERGNLQVKVYLFTLAKECLKGLVHLVSKDNFTFWTGVVA